MNTNNQGIISIRSISFILILSMLLTFPLMPGSQSIMTSSEVYAAEEGPFDVKGTVFPYVNSGDADFDELHEVTVSLYEVPNDTTTYPVWTLLDSTPAYTATVGLYTGEEQWMPELPKNPGRQGLASNPGLAIDWRLIGITSGVIDNTPLETPADIPTTDIGYFRLDDVEAGDYILAFSRDGFLPRFEYLALNDNKDVKHRELIAGNVDGDLEISQHDSAEISQNGGSTYGSPGYDAKYDLNGDKAVDTTDAALSEFSEGFYLNVYENTSSWLSGYMYSVLEGSVGCTGTLENGETLTADVGGITSPNTGTLRYQWKRGGVNISGATNSTYVMTPNDVGQTITVRVIAPNYSGSLHGSHKISVTLNVNGGEALSNNKLTVTNGKTYGKLPVATRAGYTFDGWYTDESTGTEVTSGTAVTETADHDLYAHWTVNQYNVTFSAIDADSVSKYSKNVTFGEEYGDLAIATKAGYTFSGWYTTPDGINITPGSIVTTDYAHTLYAKFTKDEPVVTKHTVTLDTNGGKPLSNNKLTVTNGGKYGNLPTPDRTGYKFKGWYTSESGGTHITSSTTVDLSADQVLFAQWEANKYKITFMGNKGKIKKSGKYKVSKLTQRKTYGKKYGPLPKVKRTGYKFKGWYTKRTGGKKVTGKTVMNSARNIKLYARWIPNARIVNCNWTHMRNAPGVHKLTTKYVKRGTKAAILKTIRVSGKYKWYKVRVGNKTGYIYAKYVKRI